MDNLRGILLMVGAMALFAVEDGLIRTVSGTMPTGQILLGLGLIGFVVFFIQLRLKRIAVVDRAFFEPAVMARNGAEVIGTLGFVTALTLIPLSTATTILQAAPLIVTMGAALFFGETVGWRRWTAILVGFLGVLLVVKPGMAGFDANVLWAVLGVVFLSLRDLATRRIRSGLPSALLVFWAYCFIMLLGCGLLVINPPVSAPAADWTMLAAAGLIGVCGYWAITEAMRSGDVSAIAPFRYSRLVFGLAVGMLAFGERPDALAILGALLIMGSGLYAFFRERAVRRLNRA